MKTRRLDKAMKGAGLLLVAAALGGCASVGPDFSAPPPISKATVFANAPAGGGTGAPSPVQAGSEREGTRWWKVLGDSQLDALEERALSSNPSLETVAARIAEARARLRLTKAERSPALTTNDSARLLGESSERTLPLPSSPVKYRDAGDSYRLALEASWEPDLWGRVRRSTEGVAAQLEAAEADARAARLALSADLALTYATVRGLEAELAVLGLTLDQRHAYADLLATRIKHGLGLESEVQRAHTEIALLEAEQEDLQRRRSLALNALAQLCGTTPGDLALAQGALPPTPMIPAGIPAEVLRRRPDIAAAEATLHARTAEIGVAEAARYPSIRLTGGGGFESGDLLNLLERPAQFWQLGPMLTMPLIDGGRTRAGIEAATARAEAARADHRARCLAALREVEDALAELRHNAKQTEALLRAGDTAREAASLLKVRHEGGLATYLDVLDAERSCLQAERNLTQARTARLASTVKLVKALGGAW